MAKDGTNRGGARPGAGRPRKALTEKIAEGKSAEVMMQPADIESAETPPVRDFMKELQRDGTKLLADDVYTETYQWLKERSCEKIVSRQLVEQYAMSISRWIHCERSSQNMDTFPSIQPQEPLLLRPTLQCRRTI